MNMSVIAALVPQLAGEFGHQADEKLTNYHSVNPSDRAADLLKWTILEIILKN